MSEAGNGSSRIAVIGGTGFVGSYVVDALHAAGYTTSLLVRHGSAHKLDATEQTRVVAGDVDSESAVREVLEGCDAVIYLVGILRDYPGRGITFEATQYDGVVRTADAAVELGIRRFLLMSANGVDANTTPYQRTKLMAENYVKGRDLDVTVMRPSVIFGNPRGRMEFATQLYRDMVRLPFPAVGFFSGWSPSAGAVMMSPVHVQDVAAAFVRSLQSDDTIGKTYELGGPESLSWTQMLERIAAAVGTRKLIIPMPIGLMRVGATLLDWLPFFPVTRDQLTMLEQNNTCDSALLESLLGKTPMAFAAENLLYLNG